MACFVVANNSWSSQIMDLHLSPTNIATYYHNNCQLYLHNTYHRALDGGEKKQTETSPLVAAQFQRGLDWEDSLFHRLSSLDQLVRVDSSVPKTAIEIRDIILEAAASANSPKYIVNLAFQSPSFTQELLQYGSSPSGVTFGVAKPDILKITRRDDHEVIWEVIDAKSSSALKSSHNAQIGFYHLCLEKLLDSVPYEPDSPILIPSENVSIWMPGAEDQDELSEPVTTPTYLLLPALRTFLFKTLPPILSLPRNRVEWHLNPSCQGCEFFDNCKESTVQDKRLGMIPDLSISDARSIRDVIETARALGMLQAPGRAKEIDELDTLINSSSIQRLEAKYSGTTKQFQRLLGVQGTKNSRWSPLLKAAMTHEPQLTRKRVFTFPRSEDVAIYISVINDIAKGGLGAFVISVKRRHLMSHQAGLAKDLVPKVSGLLRKVQREAPDLRIQIYTYSPVERKSIMDRLIDDALSDQSGDMDDIRLCLGALCEGTSLLSTTYQPAILSGVLLSFLSKKNALSKKGLQTCCERLGLKHDGTAEELRKRLEAEQRRLAEIGGRAGADINRREVGQLEKIVVLKREVERLLSLPIPGFIDLPQTAQVLLGKDKANCLADDVLFGAWVNRSSATIRWEQGLKERNRCMHAIATNLRARVEEENLTDKILLNDAKVLELGMMDICESRQLRKLMFMLQFEVVLRLHELWRNRLDGCPNAPLLKYVKLEKNGKSWRHIFDIISGTVEPPVDDYSFYNWLLVAESDSESVPPEIYFDDLSLCALFFPLTQYTKHKWDEQLAIVKDNICICNVADIRMASESTNRKPHSQAVVQLDYTTKKFIKTEFKKDSIYRISPRLVDFNFSRVLLNLVTMDFQHSLTDDPVPFMDLIENPIAFAGSLSFCGDRERRIEKQIMSGLNDLSKIELKNASALMLKASQHQASLQMMMKRLSVIWGPPGTGKTYTLALSTLRMLEALGPSAVDQCRYVFVTAMTHAAIEAIFGKIKSLMVMYRALKDRDSTWLDGIHLERVLVGSTHKAPTKRGIYIYAGTTFQLYKFCDKVNIKADMIIIDEAGQLALGTAALAIRWLSERGKLVLAGDHEQLAPILGTSYPDSEPIPIFGSILDMLMGKEGLEIAETFESQKPNFDRPVVQLLENFRLNGDLGSFVETIYRKKFVPMKSQALEIAESLHLWLSTPSEDKILEQARIFLLNLADVMAQSKSRPFKLIPPKFEYIPKEGVQHSTSLALIRVKAAKASILPYEAHVQAEARLAAALVHWLRESFGNEETIFVACPHRIQRSAVRQAILSPNESAVEEDVDELSAALEAFHMSDNGLRIDTIERLQGSEASFVIFLLSHTHAPSLSNHLEFLLSRRRLNVGISRAKSLCIMVSSKGVLQPSLEVLTNSETRKGLKFLRDYENRAWIGDIDLEI